MPFLSFLTMILYCRSFQLISFLNNVHLFFLFPITYDYAVFNADSFSSVRKMRMIFLTHVLRSTFFLTASNYNSSTLYANRQFYILSLFRGRNFKLMFFLSGFLSVINRNKRRTEARE